MNVSKIRLTTEEKIKYYNQLPGGTKDIKNKRKFREKLKIFLQNRLHKYFI